MKWRSEAEEEDDDVNEKKERNKKMNDVEERSNGRMQFSSQVTGRHFTERNEKIRQLSTPKK